METQAAAETRDEGHPFPIGIIYNGDEKREPVTPNERIKAVLDRAIQLFHVTQQPHMLSLFNEEGDELNDSTTVAENSITKKSVLYLRQSKVKGGSSGC